MDKRQKERLYSEVASCLGARQVLVFMRPPPTIDAAAETYREGRYTTIIDLMPGLRPALEYRAFLHECAHAALHFPADLESTLPMNRFKPASERFTPTQVKALEESHKSGQEREADDRAAIWDAWAEERVASHLKGNEPLELKIRLKLTALKHYSKRG